MQTKDVFSSTFLKVSSKKGELLSKLNDLHRSLSTLSQDVEELPKGLKLTSAQLVSDKILSHADKDVRLMAACCLVDILRVYAPEAPFGDDEMVSVFEVIIAQLRSLSTHDTTSAKGMKIFYILNSLSTVKSCVVPVILAQNGVPGASDLVVSLFDSLLSSIRPDHLEDVNDHMASILQACIEESDEIDPDIMDILLTTLLPANKAENPAAFNIVSNVLRNLTTSVQGPISEIINQILVGSMNADKGRNSELGDHIYSLIYELHKINPGLLLRVLPNICIQLHVEEEEIRLKAVKLLGRLFASPHAEYGVEFTRNFRDFLGRFVDVSSQVRLEMVESGYLIMKKKPNLIAQVEDSLVRRLRDSDQEVRMAALSKLIDVTFQSPTKFTIDTFKEMGERVKDKKIDIKKIAMQGLCRMYSRHISSSLPSLDLIELSGSRIADSGNTELMQRLSFVPGLILNCWGFPELAMKHTVLQLTQEYLLPKSSKTEETNSPNTPALEDIDDVRATATLLMFSLLNPAERLQLSSIILFKTKVRNEICTFINARQKVAGNDHSSKVSHDIELKKSMHRLLQLLPPSDKKNSFVEKINSLKDKHIFRLLGLIEDHDQDIQAACEHRDDLKQRVDSKSLFGEHMGMIFDVGAYMIVNKCICSKLMTFIIKSFDNLTSISSDVLDASTFLTIVSKQSPQIFLNLAALAKEWFIKSCSILNEISSSKSKTVSCNQPVMTSCLTVITQAATALSQNDSSDSLCSALLTQAMKNNNASLCEQFAEAASKVSLCRSSFVSKKKPSESLIASTIKDLCSAKKMSSSNSRLICDLSILVGLLKIPFNTGSVDFYSCYTTVTLKPLQECSTKILEFVTHDVLTFDENDDLNMPMISTGLKLWASLLTAKAEISQLKGTSAEIDKPVLARELKELLEVLFETMETEGASVRGLQISGKANKLLMYECAATCTFNLLKIISVGCNMTVNQWQTLGWSLLVDNADSRRRLLNTYSQLIQTNSIHHRFLAYPCLLANDENLSAQAQSTLKFYVKRLRYTHEELLSRALFEENEEIRQKAEVNMPETIFPYVLYLISYHPDFPEDASVESEGDKRRVKGLVRSVKMVLQVLFESLQNQADNISFLLKQVQTISQFYEDRNDPANIGLQFVTKIALKCLNESVKTAENAQAFPGDIQLPMDLFQQSEAKSNRNQGQGYELGEADLVIGKAVSKSKISSTIQHKKQSDSELKATKAVPSKKSKSELPSEEPVRISSRAKRLSGGTYVEPDESDRETEMWDAQAGEDQKDTHISGRKRGLSENIPRAEKQAPIAKNFSQSDFSNDSDDEQPIVKRKKTVPKIESKKGSKQIR